MRLFHRAGVLSQRDYYEVLGVSRSASAREIRKAYKKLARQYHPDANDGDADSEQKFAELTEAHEVLGDSQKRRKYDQFGHNWSRVPDGATGAGDFHGFRGGGTGAEGFAFEDIIGNMFGGGGSPFSRRSGPRRSQRPQVQKGEDLRTSVQVPFFVGVEGGEHEVTVRTGGKSQRLNFRIPPGIDGEKTIRLAGQGHPGHLGGPPGDVLVTVEVTPHPYFRREGTNLILDVPVSVTEATLGAKIEVPTLTEGTVVVSVPPGTSSGAKLRLRGKGALSPSKRQRGDQIVVIKIVVPQNLTEEVEQMLRSLEKIAPQNPREELWQ